MNIGGIIFILVKKYSNIVKKFLFLLAVLFLTGFICETAIADKSPLKNEAAGSIIKDLIKYNPSFSNAQVEVEFTSSTNDLLEDLEKGAGKITFKVDMPANKKTVANIAVPVLIYKDGRFVKKTGLQSKLKIYKNVLSAARKIKKGGIFSGSDITFINKDILSLPDSVLYDPAAILGKQARTYMPAGTILLEWMIRGVPVVIKGDIVEVTAKIKGVTVTSKAEIMEDGYLKDMIKVKNLGTKKIIEAVVINAKKVEAQ